MDIKIRDLVAFKKGLYADEENDRVVQAYGIDTLSAPIEIMNSS